MGRAWAFVRKLKLNAVMRRNFFKILTLGSFVIVWKIDIETRFAFGSLVEAMRRRNGLTMEKLAEKARIDVVEIRNIERDAHHRAEPRTVYQLASTFGLPNKALLQDKFSAELQICRRAR